MVLTNTKPKSIAHRWTGLSLRPTNNLYFTKMLLKTCPALYEAKFLSVSFDPEMKVIEIKATTDPSDFRLPWTGIMFTPDLAAKMPHGKYEYVDYNTTTHSYTFKWICK